MQAKDDDKRRKLGYGRIEDGPDDNRVPDYYNLTSLGERQTSKKWAFTKKDKRSSFRLTKNIGMCDISSHPISSSSPWGDD